VGWSAASCRVAFAVLNAAPVQHAIAEWIATTVLLAITAVAAVAAVIACRVAAIAFSITALSPIAPVFALEPQEEP
jgi:hypothetical protein